MNENANAATLKPGSKYKEGAPSKQGNSDIADPLDSIEDTGAAVVRPTDKNGIFDAKTKKVASRRADKEGGEKTPVKQGSSKIKQMAEDEEPVEDQDLVAEDEELEDEDLLDEDEEMEVELSEEMEDFIAEMIEEGYSEEEILEALEENFELVTEEAEEESDDEESEYEDDLQEDFNAVEAFEINLDEHVDALLEGEELSEDFKEKAKTIFEAALNEKLNAELVAIEQAYYDTLQEELSEIVENLNENVDDYLNYVVENWMTENEVAVEAGLRTEITEDFISGLKSLFGEHYIDIPEDKFDLVNEMKEELEAVKSDLNEQIERNIELSNVLNESQANEIVAQMCEGLTDVQADKLRTLAEGINFTDEETFTEKVQTLRESYFPEGEGKSKKAPQMLDEEILNENNGDPIVEEAESGRMAAYTRSLGKTAPK